MTRKKPDGEKKKRGRKSQFDPNKHPAMVKELAEKGLTNEQIAGELHISDVTLNAWMQKNPEFLSAIRAGKNKADDQVEQSLFKRTQGLKIREITVIHNPDGTMRKEIKEKEIPPDPGACYTWLKCRRPKEWRDVQKMEVTGKNGAPLIPAHQLSDEDVERRAREILAKRKH